MLSYLKALFMDEAGQDMIEYALLGSLISIIAISIILLIGAPLINIYQEIVDALTPG